LAGKNPLSDYRALIGGAWAHSDSGAAKGTVTAAVMVRTRLWDGRGANVDSSFASGQRETWFADLLVDAQFVTKQPVASGGADVIAAARADSVFIQAVTSSQIAAGLFLGLPRPVFWDRARIGPTLRFRLSSQEGRKDVFRRLSWGLRMENRSATGIRGAAVEVGFAPNQSAGLVEGDLELGFQRVLIDAELPLSKSRSRRGLYIQFHTEYPFRRSASDVTLIDGVSVPSQNLAPPVYQFRVAATFDPAEIAAPWFGD
jgi:hypothetical protein